VQNEILYKENLIKEAEFWGKMAEERWKGGIPLTMDYQLGTRYRVRRSALGWGDYIQDPGLEAWTPFGLARKRFVDFAKKCSGEKALDLCCGAGWLSLELARAGKTVDAIDISEREINVAKQYQSQLKVKPKGKIYWNVADLNIYKLDTNAYDLVTAWDGLHHIPNIEGICKQIYHSLKPGGRFLFCERIWGGNGRTFKIKVCQMLEIMLNLILPLTIPYSKRIAVLKDIFKVLYNRHSPGKKFKSDNPTEANGFSTPFEDSTGIEMLYIIKDMFKTEIIDDFGAFSEEACRSLNLPRFLRVPSILFLSWFDYLWIKIGLLDGKLLMGYMQKNE
jgi:2-polyprenyl-3-methyl-5-hydroxy-6-metoxy-1,4-benzoquinol methylase